MPRDIEEKWSSEYDSTWEDAEEQIREADREQRTRQQHPSRKWYKRAAWDLQNYRHGYREETNSSSYLGEASDFQPKHLNLDFYQKKRPFEPEGLHIDVLLKDWKTNYNILERNHYYIQWLFPLRERGMNSCAKPLTQYEIQMMMKEKEIGERFIAAYELMLGFYGIKLHDNETGEVTRAENWEERFKNLNNRSHNNLRITRILKCLGELGYGKFQAPLVRFFLEETLCNGQLQNVKRSVLDYFMFTVKDKIARKKLVHFAWSNYKPQEKFIWGPVEALKKYQPDGISERKVNETEGNLVEKGYNGKHYKNCDLDNCKRQVEREPVNVLDSSGPSDSENTAYQNKSKPHKGGSKELIPMNEREDKQNKGKHDMHNNLDDMKSKSNSGTSPTKGELISKNVYVNKCTKQQPVRDDDGTVNGETRNDREQGGKESHRKRKLSSSGSSDPPSDSSVALDKGSQVDGVEDIVKKLKLVDQSYSVCNNTVDDTSGANKGEMLDNSRLQNEEI